MMSTNMCVLAQKFHVHFQEIDFYVFCIFTELDTQILFNFVLHKQCFRPTFCILCVILLYNEDDNSTDVNNIWFIMIKNG